MRLNTLRTRAVTWSVGLLAVVLVVFGVTLYGSVHGYLVTSLQHVLLDEANDVGTKFLAFEEQKGSPWMAGEISEAYSPELSGRFTREDGMALYQSGDTSDPILRASEVSHPAVDENIKRFHYEDHAGTRLLLCTLPFRPLRALHT